MLNEPAAAERAVPWSTDFEGGSLWGIASEGVPLWRTASEGGAADSAPGELEALSAHVGQCRGRHARLGAAACALEALQGFVGARLVTTLAAVAAAAAVAVWLWSSLIAPL